MVCLTYLARTEFPINIVYFVLNMICAIVSVIGNGTVIYAIVTIPRLRSATNWLLASLALSDLISALFGQTTYSVYLSFLPHTSNCIHEKAGVYISAMSCGTSLLTLCLITRDRYLHVAQALCYNKFTSTKQVCVLIFISWLAGNAVAVTFTLDGRWQQILGCICFAVLGFGSFLYIAIMYRRLNQAVQSHFNAHKIQPQKLEINTLDRKAKEVYDTERCQRGKEREQSANKSILMIVGLFAAVWFPFLVVMVTCFVYTISGLGIPPRLRTSFVWTSILSFVNGAINPMIYARRYHDLGGEMKRILFCNIKSNTCIS